MEPENTTQPIPPAQPVAQEPVQPQTPPPVQTSPQQTAPKSKFSFRKWPILLLAILFLILIIGGGFLLLSKKSVSPTPTPAPVVTTVPTPTPDPTASWKTYTETGFSIKLPTDWHRYYPYQGAILTYKNYDDSIPDEPATDKMLRIEINSQPSSQDLQTYVNSITTNNKSGPFQTTNLTIDGQPAIEIYQNNSAPVIYVKPTNSDIIYIGFLGSFANHKDLVNQILSTFKFTSSNSANDISNWKTYTGNYFTIKYPDGWTINDQSYSSGGQLHIGFTVDGPMRTDLSGANGKNAYYLQAVKYDTGSEALAPNTAFGPTGEEFVFEKQPGDQSVNPVSVTTDYIANSSEHETAAQILATFKLTK